VLSRISVEDRARPQHWWRFRNTARVFSQHWNLSIV